MSSITDFFLVFIWDRMSVSFCLCIHLHYRATNIHICQFRMGWSSELCRALTESSFEMYIQCESLKWFLLNSIFYRFCRHFVVGRKKNKRNFIGACLCRFSVTHKYLASVRDPSHKHILFSLPHREQIYNNYIVLIVVIIISIWQSLSTKYKNIVN